MRRRLSDECDRNCETVLTFFRGQRRLFLFSLDDERGGGRERIESFLVGGGGETEKGEKLRDSDVYARLPIPPYAWILSSFTCMENRGESSLDVLPDKRIGQLANSAWRSSSFSAVSLSARDVKSLSGSTKKVPCIRVFAFEPRMKFVTNLSLSLSLSLRTSAIEG